MQVPGPHKEDGGQRQGQRMVPPARETAFLPSFPQALVKVKGMTPGPPTSIPGL